MEDIHPHARAAAAAAEAAGVQGQFWAMHEQLFEHQKALEDRHLRQYALDLGLQPDRFDRDRASPDVGRRIERDLASGERGGVQGTPTFYINGVRHDGPFDVDSLRSAMATAMTGTTGSDTPAARIAFLRGLRAVRQLRPDPLPDAVLHDILEVARWSGSAGNRQPWEFVVVRDRAMLRRLSAIDGANAGHLATAAVGIAIVIRPEVPDLDAYDEGRLAERILLAAAAHGLGAAVGHFTGPGDTWAASAEAKRLLGIPDERVVRETISLGYPAEHLLPTTNPPGRKPLEQLVHWERY